jgi:hypothetical protein
VRLPAGRRRRMPRLRFGRSEAQNPRSCSKPTASISLIYRRSILWKARFTCVPAPHFKCSATRTAPGAGSPSSASCPYPSPTSATTSSPRIDTELGGDRQSFLIKSKRYDQRKTCTSPLNDLRCFCLPVVISNVSR